MTLITTVIDRPPKWQEGDDDGDYSDDDGDDDHGDNGNEGDEHWALSSARPEWQDNVGRWQQL